jgi:hypothetical protein
MEISLTLRREEARFHGEIVAPLLKVPKPSAQSESALSIKGATDEMDQRY